VGKKFGFSFSWKRAFGISSMKGKISRSIGVPLTKSGRQRKMGSAVGCCIILFSLSMALILIVLSAASESYAVTTNDNSSGNFYHTQLGVILFVPNGFSETSLSDKLNAQKAFTSPDNVALDTVKKFSDKSFLKGDQGEFSLEVISIPWNTVAYSQADYLAESPNQSGTLPESIANAFVKSYLAGSDQAGLSSIRSDVKVTPLLYDNEKKMSGIRIVSRTLSPAKTVLSMAEDSDFWKQASQGGIAVSLYKCILSTVDRELNSNQEVEAALNATANKCSIDIVTVRNIFNLVTKEYFMPGQLEERVLNIANTQGLTLIRFDSTSDNLDEISANWDSIWSQTASDPSFAIHEGPFSKFSISNRNPYYILGSVIGSIFFVFIFGSLFQLVLIAIKIPPKIAAVIAGTLMPLARVLLESYSEEVGTIALGMFLGALITTPILIMKRRKPNKIF
jgi:hypothetical protein